MRSLVVCLAFACFHAVAQTPCAKPVTYATCDIALELTADEMAAHSNPYLTLTLYAELKSPKFKTFLLPAFQDRANRFLIRFTPTDPGTWEWRLTSGLKRFDGQKGTVEAAESNDPGFIQPANVHHWVYPEKLKGHLWMGDTFYNFATVDRKLFEKVIDTRAAQKFNHIRGMVFPLDAATAQPFKTPDEPNLDFFRELDARLSYINQVGLIADLVLGSDQNQLAIQFPQWQQRERFIKYITARYAAFNITWQVVQEFEEYKDGRAFVKELGLLLKKHDPYNHPRTTHTTGTTGPLLADGWTTHLLYQSSDDALGAIEHQLYMVPQVNAEFGYEDSGAGKSHAHHIDATTFRKRLWNATMNGQYPTFGNTGTYGGRKFPVDAKYLDSTGAKLMTYWYEFMANTRYWELEPYFYVDGGRALALIRDFGEDDREAVEYIVYIENPRLVEVEVVRHTYQVYWFDPATGQKVKGKDFKGNHFVSEPPDKTHDWVLHLSRDGKKEGLLRSYKFDSRPFFVQEIEPNSTRNPFTMVKPDAAQVSLSKPIEFEAKLLRPTRGTRTMLYLWTVEVNIDGQGYRVAGGGEKGTLKIPPDLAKKFPAVMTVRCAAMNANGKIYVQDKVVRLTQ